jgi:hypothetical protein
VVFHYDKHYTQVAKYHYTQAGTGWLKLVGMFPKSWKLNRKVVVMKRSMSGMRFLMTGVAAIIVCAVLLQGHQALGQKGLGAAGLNPIPLKVVLRNAPLKIIGPGKKIQVVEKDMPMPELLPGTKIEVMQDQSASEEDGPRGEVIIKIKGWSIRMGSGQCIVLLANGNSDVVFKVISGKVEATSPTGEKIVLLPKSSFNTATGKVSGPDQMMIVAGGRQDSAGDTIDDPESFEDKQDPEPDPEPDSGDDAGSEEDDPPEPEDPPPSLYMP